MSALGDILLGDLVEHDAVIGELARNGRIVATELYRVMINMIIQFAPGLVIVDALADSFAGDENNRAQARQFISMLRRPAIKHHCAFLALAHPSLSGITTGRGTSGTTGWSNSVRARTYLETFQVQDKEPDPNLKILRQPKANYAGPGFELLLSYQNGVLAPVVSDARLSHLEKTLQAEEVFMTILKRLFQDGRYVGPSPGINYAPAVFADEPEANMISKDRLKRAMISLFEKKRIIIEPYGEKARGKKRIAEAPF
jgi:RecA-family ATPase